MGNGRSVVVVQPWGFRFHRGKGGEGKFRLELDGQPVNLEALKWDTLAFPGGIIFRHESPEGTITVFQTALADDPYGVLIKLGGKFAKATFAIDGGGEFQRRAASTFGGVSTVGASVTGRIAGADFDKLHDEVLSPYIEGGMVLRSPDAQLDQAVLFNQYLLDLSYNGDMIVCELFRWADIWSRDLGSGFAPGALLTNRIEPARKSIDVDLARHEKATARALKTTGDASQGGSLEGVSHLTDALWTYYGVTGDKAYLRRVAEGLRPWMEAWLARDYLHRGLVIDTTDWMDHSRVRVLSFGSPTLYSNALMVRLLGEFALIERELGDEKAAQHWTAERSRFVAGINEQLWSESLGAYANLLSAGQQDERTASAANSLAILAGVADPARTRRVLDTLKAKNWRPDGTLTITPRMTYDPDNDQNEKIWPWWTAYEAMARFRNGDPEGGLRLLDNCAATIRNPTYPGMMAEILGADGRSEGGRAFATAAGSFLRSIQQGLFGIDFMEGGMRALRIVPHLPPNWKDASLHVPTPGGSFDVVVRNGALFISVNDPRVKTIMTTQQATVRGAKKVVWRESPASAPAKPGKRIDPPAFRDRKTVVFTEEGFPSADVDVDARYPRIGWDLLAKLDAKKTGAVIVRGNALPFFTPDGTRMQEVLSRYLDEGGMIVFLGATMRGREGRAPSGDPAGKLGGDGGVAEWYAKDEGRWRPVHPRSGEPVDTAKRDGTIYWGDGDYFGGWDVSRGVMGFQADGHGLRVAADSPLRRSSDGVAVKAIFTDFAVRGPWYFQPLATTHTEVNFMLPQRGENFACVARLVNRDTGGEILLVADGAVPFVDPGRLGLKE